MRELCLVQKRDQGEEGEEEGSSSSTEISHLQSQLRERVESTTTNWNFTNAAILLQNSSSVYSRKVEYLHSLVYQTLHRLSDNSNGTKDNGNGNGNGNGKHKKKQMTDIDIQEFEAFDPDCCFLVFDEDTLPLDLEGNMIDLQQDQYGASSSIGIGIGMNSNSNSNTTMNENMEQAQHSHATPLMNINTNMNMNQTRLSLDRTAMGSITRNKSTIHSHAGQQLIRSVLEGSQGNGNSNGGGMRGIGCEGQAVLRLMNGVCDVSDSGALLLPGIDIGIGIGGSAGEDGNGSMQERLDMDEEDYGHGHGVVNHNEGIAALAGAGAGTGGPVQFDQGQDYDDGMDDHDNDGTGFELHSPYPRPSMHPDETIATNAHGTTTDNGANVHANTNAHAHAHAAIASTSTSPWDLLDPHDASESKSRPLRKAITFCLPHGVQQPPSALVTGARTRKIPRARVRAAENDNHDTLEDGAGSSLAVREYRAALQKMHSSSHDDMDMDVDVDLDLDTSISNENEKQKQKMVPLPIQPLAFGDEFLYVLQSQKRQRAVEKRRIKKLQRVQQQGSIGIREEDGPGTGTGTLGSHSNRGMDANERFDDMYDDNDEDDIDGPAFDFAGGDYDNGDDHDHDIDNDDNVFNRVFARDANADGTAGVGVECKTFEELCREHLKEFARGAERFAVETHLSKRVENWQTKLEVVLAEEEERPEFDIQLYGNRIMSSAQDCLQREMVSGMGGLVSFDTFVSFTSFLVVAYLG